MSKKELQRFNVIENAVNGNLTVNQAAERLNLSTRRIKQLKKEFRENGVVAVVHGNANKPSKKRLSEDLQEQILNLRKDPTLSLSNFTHFHEILVQNYNIELSYSSLYRILTEAGFSSPKKRRSKKNVHSTRERRAAEGMLLQADATSYEWFGDNVKYALHGFIDDATGKITGLYISKNECLLGYLEVLRQTLTTYGIPACLYPDRYSVFFVNPKKAQDLTIEEQLEGLYEKKTQFGRIVDELGINMFPAHSPEAKGRIERLWDTLQSRLPVEFALARIKTVEEANRFLKDVYIAKFNAQFAVEPKETFPAYIPVPHTQDLDRLLSVVIERKLSPGSTISIHNITYKIEQKIFKSKTPVSVLLSEKHGIRALINGDFYPIYPIEDITNAKTEVYINTVITNLIQTYFYKDAKK